MQREQSVFLSKEEEAKRDFVREEWDREDSRSEKELENKKDIEQMRQDNVDSRYYQESLLGKGDQDKIALSKLQAEAERIKKEFAHKDALLKEEIRSNKADEEIKRKQASKPTTKK
jgi:hypothetical protein